MPEIKKFRLGILGGMGPEAGVLLQQLIIRQTPARCDQDHIAVVTFTNPHIPDRTRSLAEDGGASYLQAVIESLHLLERCDVDLILMACNTAHARLPEIQEAVHTPILNMVGLAKERIAAENGNVAILATDGTVEKGLFNLADDPAKILVPTSSHQKVVMEVIRAVKAGTPLEELITPLKSVIEALSDQGASAFLLGCTELSVLHDLLIDRCSVTFIDPLRLAALRVVEDAL
ncbi:aspartate racemase [candidate division BRC1 bacterium HGW-BRC1-1]|jgi:aspartate racemase|nr:MAG: aspartate racemase [candidate division BRC1 bacterium HGW-BRC1-1]